MKVLLKKFFRDEDGATLVEYGVALLVVIIVGGGALITLANNTTTNFEDADSAITYRPPAPVVQ